MLLSEGSNQVISISEIWSNWCMKLQSQGHLYFKKTEKWSWLSQAHYSDISNMQLCAGANATLTWMKGWASVQPQCMWCSEVFAMPSRANVVRKWKKQEEIERHISSLDLISFLVTFVFLEWKWGDSVFGQQQKLRKSHIGKHFNQDGIGENHWINYDIGKGLTKRSTLKSTGRKYYEAEMQVISNVSQELLFKSANLGWYLHQLSWHRSQGNPKD